MTSPISQSNHQCETDMGPTAPNGAVKPLQGVGSQIKGNSMIKN